MEWYEAEVKQLERNRNERVGMKAPAAFYGSSTIRLWDTLAQDLKNPCALNVGFGGSTLEACVYFFERLIPPLGPQSLVVYAGDNDLGDGKAPEQVLGYFNQLLEKVGRELGDIPLVLIAVKPSPARVGILDRIRRTNAYLEKAVTAHRNGVFVPMFDAMLSAEKMPRPELFREDGLHLARAGYELWIEQLEPYRNIIFNRNSADCNPGAVPSNASEQGVSQVV